MYTCQLLLYVFVNFFRGRFWSLVLLCLVQQSVVVFCLVFRRKSAAQFFSNVHVSFVFRGRSAVQFFSNVHVCFVLCHVHFYVFVDFTNAHVCFVLCHVHFLYLSILVMFMSVLCSVMFSFLNFWILFFPSILMFFKCSLCIFICECIWLFLSSSIVCLFFVTL